MSLRATQSSFLGLIKETTYGTYQAPTGSSALWVPYKNPTPEDTIKYLEDQGIRGSMGDLYAEVEGVGSGVFSFDTDFFGDTTPGLFQAILGGTDTVASVSASVWSHTFSLLNNAASVGNQPTSWSLTDFDGYEARGYAAGRLSDLNLKWQADGLVECTAKWISNRSASVATPTSGFSTLAPAPAWNIVTTIGGTASVHVESGEIDLVRKTAQPFTANASQDPFDNFTGTLQASFKATMSAEDDTEYNYFRNNAQPTFQWKVTDPSSGDTFTISAQIAAFTVGKPIRSKEYLQWDTEGKFVFNTTNATSGGYSPVQCVAQNGRSTAY